MHPIEEALKEARMLHEQLTHSPAPEFGPEAFLPFPPGQDPVAYAIQEVSQLKQLVDMHAAAATAADVSGAPRWVPRAGVYAGEQRVAFVVEIPGVEREDLSVSVQSGQLCVRGERKPLELDGSLQPLQLEHQHGCFERRFPIPAWCDPERITARCSQGLLTVELQRSESKASGEFEISVKG